jgi:hypothetical protein
MMVESLIHDKISIQQRLLQEEHDHETLHHCSRYNVQQITHANFPL